LSSWQAVHSQRTDGNAINAQPQVSTQDFTVPVYQQLANPQLVLTSIPGNGSFTPLAYQLGTAASIR
jgi:hypothetical protein